MLGKYPASIVAEISRLAARISARFRRIRWAALYLISEMIAASASVGYCLTKDARAWAIEHRETSEIGRPVIEQVPRKSTPPVMWWWIVIGVNGGNKKAAGWWPGRMQ